MFKKDISAGAKSKLKSSAQRSVRAKVSETYPALAPHIDVIIPKKEQLDVIKLPDRTTLYTLSTGKHGSEPLFYQHMDDDLIPHLRLVHRYPDCFSRLRVDRGAIRFVLSGAALMTPGFTSAGGRLPGHPSSEQEEGDAYGGADLDAGSVVVVEAEGKEHACAVGALKMGTAEMKEKKKGIAIEAPHYVGDGLWKMNID